MRLFQYMGLALASFLVITPAQAQSDSGFYAQINGGISFSSDAKVTGEGTPENVVAAGEADVKDEAVWGLAVGYRFENGFRLDVSTKWYDFEAESSPIAGQATTGIDRSGQFWAYDTKTESQAAHLNLSYDFDKIGAFRPVITAGVGVVRHEMESFLQLTGVGIDGHITGDFFGTTTPFSLDLPYEDKTETDFTWTVGIGGLYEVNENVDIELLYRYSDFGDARVKKDAFGDNSIMKDINTQEVSLSLRYNF